ncbi:MAG: GntR family transcriptional regulator [Paracoccaceae bacterium]|jgi:GntR family transcriptional regulator
MDMPKSRPLYRQISALLQREVLAGRLVNGSRLAPERQMAEDLNTSVGTLRKALQDLTEKGFLERVQGSGNYVKVRRDVVGMYSFFRLELPNGGGVPSARILSVDRIDPDPAMPKLETAQVACRIRRIRMLDDVAVALEEIWLDGGRAQFLQDADLSDSLYQVYKEKLGFWISRVEDRVGMGHWPVWTSEDWRVGDGCGIVLRTGWAQDGAAVETSRTWFDAQKCRYVNRIQ